MNFGDRLLEIRKSKNISQEALADKIGVTRQTISNWEMNITVPNANDLRKIVKVLQVEYNDFFVECSENDVKSNNINDAAKIIIKIFKIIGIILIFGIIITILLFVILKVNFDKENVKGSKSITCSYNESIYTYSVNYNKKNKIISAEINSQVSPNDKNVEWINNLDKYVFSKKIEDPDTLMVYIINEFESNNGVCK